MSKAFSNKIIILDYLFSLLVILIHAVNLPLPKTPAIPSGLSAVPSYTEAFLSNTLGQFAVPGFFLLSGYLFYRNLTSFRGIPAKWKRRFFSLLIPYGAWNTVMYLLNAAAGRSRLTLAELGRAAALHIYNPSFWFMEQLLYFVLLAPVFWCFLQKRLPAVFLPILCLILIGTRTDLPYVNEDALFYYTSGAYFSIYYKEFTEGRTAGRACSGILLITCSCTLILLQPELSHYPAGVVILSTVLLRFFGSLGFILFLPAEMKPAAPWMKDSFFLYAFHYPLIRILMNLLHHFGLTAPESDAGAYAFLALYLALPALMTAAAYYTSNFLRKYFPTEWRVLSGGRA